MKSILRVLAFFLLLQTSQDLYGQRNYLVFLDDYLIAGTCIPYDSIKSAETISLKSILGKDTTTFRLESGQLFITGAPTSGAILGEGKLDSISQSFLVQSKGKEITIKLIFYDLQSRSQAITKTNFRVC